MATDIVLRSVKAASLTHADMDQNWESLAQTVDAVTANKTVAVTDQNKILEVSISTGTITLPTVANASGTDTDSFKITIKNINATSLTVDGNGSELIEGAASVALLENEAAEFTLSSGAAEWNITGFYNPNLVGISSSATEINYTTGTTSSIQTQIDGKQPLDADLTAIAALANTDSNFIVGNGSAWVAESGSTARASLGVDAAGTDNSTNVTLSGAPTYLNLSGQDIAKSLINLTVHVTSVLPIANGGTNSSSASGARTSLGLGALAVLDTVTGSVIDNNTITEGKFPAHAASTLYRHYTHTSNVIGNNLTPYAPVSQGTEFSILRNGAYTVSFDFSSTGTVDNCYAKIYKNSPTGYSGYTAIGTERLINSVTPTNYTENFTLVAGDVVSIHVYSAGSTDGAVVGNILISSSQKMFG